MAPKSHVGEAAELYAVGSLTATERAAVDAHVARCPECLRRLGEAEETVLALERGIVARSAPALRGVLPFERRGVPGWWLALAAAAALIVGFVLARVWPQPENATLAMIGSHFSHAQFAGASGPRAKVIYARDRSWYYVIVAGRYHYEVDGVRRGEATRLGALAPTSETSSLFSRANVPFDRLELRNGPAVIESAAIR